MVACCRVTAAPTRRRPLTVAPVAKAAELPPRRIPWKVDVEPRVTLPLTTQTMFLAKAPPLRATETPLASESVEATWKIQASGEK